MISEPSAVRCVVFFVNYLSTRDISACGRALHGRGTQGWWRCTVLLWVLPWLLPGGGASARTPVAEQPAPSAVAAEQAEAADEAGAAEDRPPWRLDGDALRVRRHGRGVASKEVQDAYLSNLRAWSAGAARPAVSAAEGAQGLSDLQQALLETLNDPRAFELLRADPAAALAIEGSGTPIETLVFTGFECLEQVERHHGEVLAELQPQAALALAELSRQVLSRQLQHPRRLWLVAHNQGQLEWAMGRVLQGAPSARRDVEGLRLAYADVLQGSGFYHHGVQALRQLERLLGTSSDHLTARYWAGFLAEKHDGPRRAAAHFQLLAQGLVSPPPSPGLGQESWLRLAVNQARLGKRRLALQTLTEVARRTSAPSSNLWVRRVAYQEWARLLLERGDEALPDVLDEALGEFPDDPGLRLLAAYRLQSLDWQRGLDALAAWHELPGGVSARRLYEQPRDAGLERRLALHGQRVTAWRAALRHALDALELSYEQGAARPVFGGCERLVVAP